MTTFGRLLAFFCDFSFTVYMFWLNFILGLNPMFLFFWGLVMYGYEIEIKENKIQNKNKIEL